MLVSIEDYLALRDVASTAAMYLLTVQDKTAALVFEQLQAVLVQPVQPLDDEWFSPQTQETTLAR